MFVHCFLVSYTQPILQLSRTLQCVRWNEDPNVVDRVVKILVNKRELRLGRFPNRDVIFFLRFFTFLFREFLSDPILVPLSMCVSSAVWFLRLLESI